MLNRKYIKKIPHQNINYILNISEISSITKNERSSRKVFSVRFYIKL